jgi:hypothetical protein
MMRENILRTLLYYDIFGHPLKPEEVFTFIPKNSIPKPEVIKMIRTFSADSSSEFAFKDGYIYVKPNDHYVERRRSREKYSRKMWLAARFVTHIIKRFPFVRAVFITGSLSKNSSTNASDLDFMIVTSSGRLWVSRTLLMLFKKVFLLNSYKYFCLNYFISERNLEIPERNIFTATEIAYLKATFNTGLLWEFIRANSWIKNYFPNYEFFDPGLHNAGFKVNNRKSILQKLLEIPFRGRLGSKLDHYFKDLTSQYWNKKYYNLDESERSQMFTTTPEVSKAHPANMQKLILSSYLKRLQTFQLEPFADG